MTFIVEGKKIIKKETGEVVGVAKTEKDAHISAAIRNDSSKGEKKKEDKKEEKKKSNLEKFRESFKNYGIKKKGE